MKLDIGKKQKLTKKSIHIVLFEPMFIEFKKLCAEHHLTMQEVVEQYLVRLMDEDDVAVQMLKEHIEAKNNRTIKKIARVEAEDIYSLIAED